MVNNVGKTTRTLNIQLGGTNAFTSLTGITIISGEVGRGFLLFDSAGTLGVVTTYVDDTDFTVTTYALSIDVESILSLSY